MFHQRMSSYLYTHNNASHDETEKQISATNKYTLFCFINMWY